MHRSRSLDLDIFNLEIKRTLKALRKWKEGSMAGNQAKDKVLRDYAMPSLIDKATMSILQSVVQAAHFEIKPAII